ncbi:hypothetical protein N8986_02145 [Flavobacteriaceae bacterium]|nr:hypothetical protein [Flavobacteriaceae bacterium]|tara:strand:- start:512 stop:1012 length:501 start_codon:yes stop_codon:yes gene_type:complete
MSTTRDESYFENMDKRTKEYKEWKALKENQLAETSKGVGDTIEKITKATGIDKVVKTFFGEDCGCGERKEALNAALPYGVVAINCIDEDDFNYLKSFFSRARTRVDASQQNRLVDIYNHVFEQRMLPPSGCATCSQKGFIKAINKLHRYYDAESNNLSNTQSNEEI